ncbi:MAG: 4Fe-4S binding protein [Kiritimatiellaeota bacterium]|nr:4Fe-4S binding protein [Kiritimatiellota bacterium]
MSGWIRHAEQSDGLSGEKTAAALAALAHAWLPDAQLQTRTLTATGVPPTTFLELQRGTEHFFLIRSDHLTPAVRGYGGQMVLALLLRADGTLADFSLLQHRETPAYVQRLSGWLASLKGRKLTPPAAPLRVDAVSGATITARALAQTFQRAGAAFAIRVLRQDAAVRAAPRERNGRAWTDGAFALLLVVAPLLRLTPRPGMRRLWRLMVLAAGGAWLNAQYSLQGVAALVRGQLPPVGLTLPFLLVVAVPLLVALLGNYYCGWLCPFGAAQELIGWLRPRRWRTEPRRAIGRHGRLMKYGLLFVALAYCALSADARVDQADPLVTIFSRFAAPPVLLLALASLALAFIFGRFWCRYLCPAGAFLALIGGLRLLPRRWRPAIKPSCCDYGVRHIGEFDCLCCDRCRMPAARPELEAATPRLFRREIVWLLAVVCATVPFLALLRGPGWQTLDRPLTAAGTAGQTLSPQVLARIRELIREQRLSEHEAKYYHAASNAAPPVVAAATNAPSQPGPTAGFGP